MDWDPLLPEDVVIVAVMNMTDAKAMPSIKHLI